MAWTLFHTLAALITGDHRAVAIEQAAAQAVGSAEQVSAAHDAANVILQSGVLGPADGSVSHDVTMQGAVNGMPGDFISVAVRRGAELPPPSPLAPAESVPASSEAQDSGNDEQQQNEQQGDEHPGVVEQGEQQEGSDPGV